MISVSEERFEELVDLGLAKVPPELLSRLQNAVILIEDYHPDGPHILGLYEGVALPDRTADYSAHLPDAIWIYRGALQDYCRTEEQLVEQVKITVIHEIGHYFGLDDEELHRLGWG
ncbi:Possibl zinc metallo-peptidase [Corynebacterium kalinowskii]|uniref:Possibl zinc metallo-peptidase n=1 Tax=Corynebacterium kalinowskii TaxID=2675216 RepID=A0A6B8V9Q7_9CORY|nr:metallopeptidase family protein [Corynebacterium kalinowskii]QGU01103.1 Possibl zinc metallo-peptidase [Corynebacterium kalinowskii]